MTATIDRQHVTVLSKRGVSLAIDRFEGPDRKPWFELQGPSYAAVIPECGCELAVCVPGWRKQCRRKHRACHGSEHGGYHEDHLRELANRVLDSYRPAARKEPAVGISRGQCMPEHFVPVDGQERVFFYAVHEQRSFHVAEWVVACSSPRCRPDGPIITHPASDKDAAKKAVYEHLAWHREEHGRHPRAGLDAWIADNSHRSVPDSDRAEIERNLAIAKGEKEDLK